MPITPDVKNWTWVLEHPCPECGFDAERIAFDEIPSIIRHNVASWQRLIAEHTSLATRPDDSTWSPLEYAAHVRDVYRIMVARLNLMLVLENPDFPNWNQDETAVTQNYNAQKSAAVSGELAAAGDSFADAVERLRPEELTRRGNRSDGSHFTAESLSLYALHDPIHHLWDVAG